MHTEKTGPRWLLVLIAGIMASAVIGVAQFGLPMRQPSYSGFGLSVWLSAYSPGCALSDGMACQRETAMATMGTNALPYIVTELRCRDSRFKSKLMDYWREHASIGWLTACLHYWPVEVNLRHARAEEAFSDLKLKREIAVPVLISLFNNDVSGEVRAFAARALGNIGPAASDAVPVLLHAVETTTNFSLRDCATETLSKIDRQRAVEHLLNAGRQQGTTLNPRIALAVARLNPQAAADAGMVTILICSLNDTDRIFVGDCANALGKLKDSRAIPALVSTLPRVADHSYATEQVIAALASFGTNASMAAPALLRVIDNSINASAPFANLDTAVGAVLMQVNSSFAASVLCTNLSELHAIEAARRVNAVRRLGLLSYASEIVVPALATCLNDSDVTVRGCAAIALSNFGNAATDTMPLLVGISRQSDEASPLAYNAARIISGTDDVP